MDNENKNNSFNADEKLMSEEKAAAKKRGRKAQLSQNEKRRITIISIAAAVILAFGITVGVCAIQARINCQPFSFATMFNLKPKGELVIATIDGIEVTAAEYNFIYTVQAQQFVQENENYLEDYGLDISKDFADQTCPLYENMNWKEYFIYQANTYAKQYALMYTKAINEGFTLSETERKSVTDYIDSLKKSAEELEYSYDEFLLAIFGSTCTEESVAMTVERILLAQAYMDKYLATRTYTEDELNAYVAENRGDYVGLNYNIFTFEADSTNPDSVTSAKNTARVFLEGVTDSDSFADQAYKYASEDDKDTYKDKNATLNTNMLASYINNSAVSDWLLDTDRQPGDKTVVYSSASGNAYAVLFLGTSYEDLRCMNIRSLTFEAATEALPEFTDAQSEAERLKSEFESNGADDAAFIALSGSYPQYDVSDNGDGYYKNLMPGEMPTPILDWCYASGRKVGDYAVLEDDAGYFLIYLSSVGDEVWHENARLSLAEEDMNEMLNSEIAQAEITESRYFYELVGI